MEAPFPLCCAFLAAAPEGVVGVGSAALEQALDAAVAGGRAAWPEVSVSEDAFMRYLGARVDSADAVAAVSLLHGADLYLACACASGDAAAIRSFSRAFLQDMDAYLSASGNRDLGDDVRQMLLERFFVGAGAAPKILGYSGRGPLAGWVRVAAVRTALSLRRTTKSTDGEPLDALASPVDVELDAMKIRFKPEFQRALSLALGTLSDRDRALLKLHYLDGVPVEHLARVYRVHRVSASRWLSLARQRVTLAARELLRQRLALTDSQFESVARLVQSQVDLSLRTVLEGADRERPA